MVLKKIFPVCCLLLVLLLSSCTPSSNNESSDPVISGSQMTKEEWYDFLLVYEQYWTADGIPGYSYPEVSPETEPAFRIEATNSFDKGCKEVELYLTEQNGKQFCSITDVYVLEKKNSAGEWEFIKFADEHVFWFEGGFTGNSKAIKPNSTKFTLKASDHSLEAFTAGEYRVMKTATCLVNGEERHEIVTGEFTIG